MYNKKLSDEWVEWVETPNSEGTRETEIFPFIKKWLNNIKPEAVADIGCGQGACSALVDEKTEYVGVEPSESLLERAHEIYPEYNKQFILGDAYLIPLGDDSVDAVMSIWVWSHLENLNKVAEEMYRVLKKGGKMLVITANPETYEERKTFYSHYEVNGNLLTGTFDLGQGKTLTDTTLYLHSKEQIEKAIKEAGFTIQSVTRMGKAETSEKGLYLAIEASKK
ncbi:MAG: class I SAM-dependent methyltransferase [Candidatus Woesearchaeota archaeon]